MQRQPEIHDGVLPGVPGAPPIPRTEGVWHASVLLRGGALTASSVLAWSGTDIAVFDTGLAHHASSLVAALAAYGVAPDQVTLVFNTHAHVDHSHNNALFHRARIFGSARDRAWTRRLHAAIARSENPAPEDVLEFYPEIISGGYNLKVVRKMLALKKLFWDDARWGPPDRFAALEDEPPPPGIRVLQSPGHAPHHLSFVIETASRPVLVCGDALVERDEPDNVLPMMPPWSLEIYRASKACLSAFDGLIVPGHDEAYDQNKMSKPPENDLR